MSLIADCKMTWALVCGAEGGSMFGFETGKASIDLGLFLVKSLAKAIL